MKFIFAKVPHEKTFIGVRVDDEDFTKLSKIRWYLRKNGYIFNSKLEYIHRVILAPNKNMVVDHKNHNKLDNRKSNLRICSNLVNLHNLRPGLRRTNSSGFRGVHWENRARKWSAIIRENRRSIYLGSFSTAEEASEAYEKAYEKRLAYDWML